MGLFKKHKKIEQIILPTEVETVETNEIAKTEEDKEEITLPNNYEGKQREIAKSYKKVNGLINALINQFYMCKFFGPAVLVEEVEKEQLLSLEKQVNKIKQENKDLRIVAEQILASLDIADEVFYKAYKEINSLEVDVDGLLTNMEETKRDHYNSLKVSSLAIIINKKADELEKINNRYTNFLNEFKSLEEASDYIYLNSGKLIASLVNSLVRCIQGSNNNEQIITYNYYYFLKSDVILCLEISEWVELYNKIAHVTHVVKGVDISNYVDFQNYLQEFELRYLILMINEERKSRGGK